MLKVFMTLLIPVFFVITGCLAFAAEVLPPESAEQVIGLIPTLIELFKNGSYLAFAAGVVMILTFIIKKYVLPKFGLGKGWLPIVAIIIGVLGSWAASVFGGASPLESILAVFSGPTAIALWDAIAKYFFKKE